MGLLTEPRVQGSTKPYLNAESEDGFEDTFTRITPERIKSQLTPLRLDDDADDEINNPNYLTTKTPFMMLFKL